MPPRSESRVVQAARSYMTRNQTVDLGVRQFDLCRYEVLGISLASWAVSWLVYIGLLFLLTHLRRRR